MLVRLAPEIPGRSGHHGPTPKTTVADEKSSVTAAQKPFGT